MAMYAVLNNNTVVEVIGSSSGNAVHGLNAVRLEDKRVEIGDVYEDGIFFRDGEPVKTWMEEEWEFKISLKKELNQLQEELDSMMVDYEYQLTELMLSPMSIALEQIENQNKNEKLYNALKRIIYRNKTDGLEEKLNVFITVGKLTQDWYTELLNLIGDIQNSN